MDSEFRKQVCDYFTAAELAELLGATPLDILWAIETDGYISEETVNELKEIMGMEVDDDLGNS